MGSKLYLIFSTIPRQWRVSNTNAYVVLCYFAMTPDSHTVLSSSCTHFETILRSMASKIQPDWGNDQLIRWLYAIDATSPSYIFPPLPAKTQASKNSTYYVFILGLSSPVPTRTGRDMLHDLSPRFSFITSFSNTISFGNSHCFDSKN